LGGRAQAAEVHPDGCEHGIRKVTGQGLIGLIRHRYGVSVSAVALVALVTANLGTAAAEFAGNVDEVAARYAAAAPKYGLNFV